MTQTIIELGVLGESEDLESRTPVLPGGILRLLIAVVLAVLCLLTLGASAIATPGLGLPLWTGSVNLTGFTIGDHALYSYGSDGKVLIARDLLTGKQLWTHDLSGLPVQTEDVGHGTTVVTTHQLELDTGDRHNIGNTITLVRTETGETLAQTIGDYVRTSGGLLVLGDDPDCTDTSCFGISVWDTTTGTRRWRRQAPSGARPVVAGTHGQVDAFGELGSDGTFELLDLATGAVTATVALPPDLSTRGGEVGLLPDILVTMLPGPTGPIFTGYRLPSLKQAWTTTVPGKPSSSSVFDDANNLRYSVFAGDCGRDACVQVTDSGAQIIQWATGAISAPINLQPQLRVGDGVLLATDRVNGEIRVDPSSTVPSTAYVVDQSGRTIAHLPFTANVDWDSHDRVMFALGGEARTGFTVIDEQGSQRALGSVLGARLTCSAHGQYLACADPGDHLRVWHLPTS